MEDPRLNARDAILARIRAANDACSPAVSIAVSYRHGTGLSASETCARLEQRLADYHVGVLHVDDETEIAAVAERRLVERGIGSLVIPADLPPAWRPGRPVPREDHGLSYAVLDGIAGVMTASRLAVAESGSIALDHGVGQGRRALTLLPDYHLCVVLACDVVGLLPEAMGLLHERVAAGAPLTFFSGPSATADIELDRVEGVHGPRRLDVILVGAGT